MACSLAALMAVGGAVVTPPALVMEVKAEEKVVEKTFTADQLGDNQMPTEHGGAETSKEDGKLTINFKKQYDQVVLPIPESIDLSQCESVTFRVENQTLPLSFKLWSGENELWVDYEKSGQTEYTFPLAGKEGVADAIGIMTTKANDKDEDGNAILFEDSAELVSVTFNMIEEEPTVVTVTPDQFGEKQDWETTSEVVDGKLKISFPAAFKQTWLKLPQKIDLSNCLEIAVSVEEQDGPISVKLANGVSDDNVVKVVYGLEGQDTYTIAPTDDKGNQLESEIDTICFMSMGTTTSLTVNSVSFKMKPVAEKPSIEWDIPDWKDSITKGIGDEAIAGVSIVQSELTDEALMDLVTKHFNAISIGNELKPDATFGYNDGNKTCPGTETVTFNGKEMVVPVMDHSRADAILDRILEWNAEHPEDIIKVRGHVLVWHSQTPEWFFHEGYVAENPYVSKEEMDQRLEWYISSMLTYYTGADSKYKGLFYGWDVVNEAVSDATGLPRTDAENPSESLSQSTHGNNSSWWHVYQSDEFITNAFKYANKYADPKVELYYNDYNECVPLKRDGIVKLVEKIKATEGARIDAIGMQAHYGLNSPTVGQFEDAARAYAKVAGKIQLTEYDMKSDGTYDGTSATRASAYNKQAYKYKEFFDSMKKLEAEGVNFDGITMWGVIDTNSWLNDQATVGGGSDGKSAQCPLLFDGKYKAKPSFWAFVDPDKLEPATQTVIANEYLNDEYGYTTGKAYDFAKGNTSVEFIPTWNTDGLKVQITVMDSTINENDKVTVYVDPDNSKSDDKDIIVKEVKRSEAGDMRKYYVAEVDIPMKDLAVLTRAGFDIKVTDDDKVISFNDLKDTQDSTSKYYADLILKPYAVAKKGTVEIDGELDKDWEDAQKMPLTINLGANVEASSRVLWDEENLYVYTEVKDAVLNKDSGDTYQQDSVEVFIDENNHKTDSYEDDDKQYRVNYDNEQSFNGPNCTAENIKSATKKTADGYVVEEAFKWTEISPKSLDEIGLELQINDADDSGKRLGTLSWYDESGTGWSSTAVYGTIKLLDAEASADDGMDVVEATGVYTMKVDKDGITAGLVTDAEDPTKLEYRWEAYNKNTPDEKILVQDWKSGSEWVDFKPEAYGDYVLTGSVRANKNGMVSSGSTEFTFHPYLKGICQMPVDGGYLIGIESFDNPDNAYKYEMLILDCTLLAQGKDAWVYTTTPCGAEGNCLWTIWAPEYGYYWTLFRIYDGDGNLIDEQCYGFENI